MKYDEILPIADPGDFIRALFPVIKLFKNCADSSIS